MPQNEANNNEMANEVNASKNQLVSRFSFADRNSSENNQSESKKEHERKEDEQQDQIDIILPIQAGNDEGDYENKYHTSNMGNTESSKPID